MTNYQPAWRRYKTWRNLLFLAALGFVPVVMLATVVARHFGGSTLFTAIMTVWTVFMISTGAEVALWRCPKCGNIFGYKFLSWQMPIFVRRCLHCGLRKYSDG